MALPLLLHGDLLFRRMRSLIPSLSQAGREATRQGLRRKREQKYPNGVAVPPWPVYVREGGGAAGLYLLLVSIPLKNLALCISWHDIEGKEGNNVTMYDYSDHEKEKPFSVSL